MKVMKDNRGLSLIELIVTVLITSILMLAVGLFVSTSRSAYQTVNISSTLQEESMTVERVISEALMEARNYDFLDGTGPYGSSVLWIRALDNDSSSDDMCVSFFVFDKNDKQLRFCKGDETMLDKNETTDQYEISLLGLAKIQNDCFGSNKKYHLVADHIESFVLKSKVERADGTGDLVSIECSFEYLSNSFTSNIAAVTRNKLRNSGS